MHQQPTRPSRPRTVIARATNGQPRTYRLAPAARDAVYRRLAIAILGLDVPTLVAELRSARRALSAPTTPRQHLAPAA
jgi:hypothetical protein